MRNLGLLVAMVIPLAASARESLDVTEYGIVYALPGMAKVKVQKDLPFGDGGLKMDLYLPAGARKDRPLPVVVFVNGVGDGGPRKLKEWRIYQDWGRLVAARGYAGVVAEAPSGGTRPAAAALLAHLAGAGRGLGLDGERIAVWSCSANVTTALPLLMEDAPRGVKAAVVYYGNATVKQIRPDLPVLSVLAGKDGAGLIAGEREMWKQAAAAHAPWVMLDEPGLPHAFDALDASEESRRVVALTLAFLDAHLGPLPPAPAASKGREILGYIYGQEDDKAAAELAKVVAADPGDTEAANRLQMMHGRASFNAGMRALGDNKPDDAVKAFEAAIAAGNRAPVAQYNLACAHARAGHADAAFKALDAALALGWSDRASLENDTDLASLHGDARWRPLVERVGQR